MSWWGFAGNWQPCQVNRYADVDPRSHEQVGQYWAIVTYEQVYPERYSTAAVAKLAAEIMWAGENPPEGDYLRDA